jgi:hypothetical protein
MASLVRDIVIASALGLLIPACTIEIADVSCTPAVFAPPQAGCAAATLDCNCSAGDGCEIDSSSDPLHCGRCGRDCGGGSCTNGSCTPAVVADFGAAPMSLALFGESVFVGLDTGIVRVDDGALSPVVASSVRLFTIDGGSLYWASEDAIESSSLSGEGPLMITPLAAPVGGIFVDPSSVLFTQNNEVRGAPKGGGDAFTLGSAETEGLGGLVADASDVFFFRATGVGFAYRMTRSGDVKTIDEGRTIADIAIDDSHVYFALPGEGPFAFEKSGALGFFPLAEGSGARALALDAADVYFATDGSIVRVPKAGGDAVVVATAEGTVTDVAVSERAIYWTEAKGASGSLVRLSK